MDKVYLIIAVVVVLLGIYLASRYCLAKAQTPTDAILPDEEQLIEDMIAVMDCPYQLFSKGTDRQTIMEAYQQACDSGKVKGFVPVYFTIDVNLFECLMSNMGFEREDMTDGDLPFDEMLKGLRKTLLNEEGESGQEILNSLLQQYIKDYNQDGNPGWQTFRTEPAYDNISSDCFTGILWDENGKAEHDLILAEIPVRQPWQVFAWCPYGDWNACPDADTHLAVARYWYEKYEATPIVIGSDFIIYQVPKPIDDDRAASLAEEQFAYDEDIVTQGVGNINTQEQLLRTTRYWYFWWD